MSETSKIVKKIHPCAPNTHCDSSNPIFNSDSTLPRTYSRNDPHAPPHRFSSGTYMVTAATLYKNHFFNSQEKLQFLQDTLQNFAVKYHWNLNAWAVFSNHYHFIAHTQENADNLPEFMKELHAVTAKYVNQMDKLVGRQVWYQYWDTHLTYQKSYFARLKYVMQNPVKHGLVKEAIEYPWCSVRWFHEKADKSFRTTVENFKCDKLNILDDF